MGNLPGIRFNLPAQQPHESRLSLAISAQQRDSLAWLDLTRNAIEQGAPPKANRKVANSDQGHGTTAGEEA